MNIDVSEIILKGNNIKMHAVKVTKNAALRYDENSGWLIISEKIFSY